MKQVGAKGDYRKGTYTIECIDQKRRLVPKCTKQGRIRLDGEAPYVSHMHVELDPGKE